MNIHSTVDSKLTNTYTLLLLSNISDINMKTFYIVFLLAAISLGKSKRHKSVLPDRTPATYIDTSDDACPSSTPVEQEATRKTKNMLQSKFWFRSCECGGPGWEKVAYYDFSQQQCPPGFTRGYGPWNNVSCHPNTNNKNYACGLGYNASITLPVEGRSYSSVCGKISGHGDGVAFSNSYRCTTSLENSYVEGVSLTHGLPGNRTHIWTFAAAAPDGDTHSPTSWRCPCSNSYLKWPHTIPDYVGRDYFCDTDTQYTVQDWNVRDWNNSLWDGQGCGPTSSCCEFNQPPYFCKHLNYTTSDDLEIRLFTQPGWTSRIGVIYYISLSHIEIYVK